MPMVPETSVYIEFRYTDIMIYTDNMYIYWLIYAYTWWRMVFASKHYWNEINSKSVCLISKRHLANIYSIHVANIYSLGSFLNCLTYYDRLTSIVVEACRICTDVLAIIVLHCQWDGKWCQVRNGSLCSCTWSGRGTFFTFRCHDIRFSGAHVIIVIPCCAFAPMWSWAKTKS